MAPQRRHHAVATACSLVLLALFAAPAYGGRALPGGAVSKAQVAANATAPALADEFLAPHNKARAAVGVAPLRWSADLAAAAARTASQQQRQSACRFADMAAPARSSSSSPAPVSAVVPAHSSSSSRAATGYAAALADASLKAALAKKRNWVRS